MKLKETVHYNLHKNLFYAFLLFLLIFGAISLTNADFSEVVENSDQIIVFLSNFLKPDWGFIPQLVTPMIQTISMSIAGTFLGVLFAIPFAFMATTRVTGNAFVTFIFRMIMSIIRTIPNLLLAALFVAMVGIGQFTGLLTIAVFTFGMVSQLIYETIETTDFGPIEANTSIGATRTQIAWWSIMPQIVQNIASYTLYAFEVNIRSSTILGYVGAGGIGVILNAQLSLFKYDRVAVIIFIILVVVLIVDIISGKIREELS